ncbi:hypothetical protein IP88_08220 [alpha proteobacterium AAP81b]|nr:hypothetical protein IP88_08220 [alpha proteobacterium AAP81b]
MAEITHLARDCSVADILAALDRDGAVIIDQLMPEARRAQLLAELDPFIDTRPMGRDEFGGFQTKRIGALMARSPACSELALDPLVNAACAAFLAPFCDGYQLHFTQAVSIGPGEKAQMLHRDRGVWGGYVPRRIETQFSTIWAATDFTAANGATRLVPGSHRWEAGREPEPHEIAAAAMPAGSVLLYSGTVIHGGGANATDQKRVGVLLHYTLGWLRQEENQYLSCPPEVAKSLSPELRALMGYTKGGFTLGFFSSPTPADMPGLELADPERLFGERPLKFETTIPAAELVARTS